MTKDEALRQALEDLKSVLCDPSGKCCINGSDADRLVVGRSLNVIKQALEETQGVSLEPEPVACVQDLDEVKRKHLVYEKGMDWKDPLYTTPPQRKPLTDEQIKEIGNSGHGADYRNGWGIPFARAIEAAHGIKGEE